MVNNTSLGYNWNLTNSPHYMKVWLSNDMLWYKCGLFVPIILFSLLGNTLVLVTIAFTSQLRTITNFFLVNLTVADLLVVLTCMPINFAQWLDNDVGLIPLVCKMRPFVQGTSVCLTIYTLTLIGVDRYRVILSPLGKRITKKYFRLILTCTWLASMLTVGPTLFVYQVGTYGHGVDMIPVCEELGWSRDDSRRFTYALLVLNYLLPIMVFLCLYGRIFYFLWYREIPGLCNMPDDLQYRMKKKFVRRKKLIRMLLTVVITFAICHFPQNFLNVLWYTRDVWNFHPQPYMEIIGFHAEIVLYLNAALNPVVYGFMHTKIKNGAIVILRSIFCCQSRASQNKEKFFNNATQRSCANSDFHKQRPTVFTSNGHQNEADVTNDLLAVNTCV